MRWVLGLLLLGLLFSCAPKSSPPLTALSPKRSEKVSISPSSKTVASANQTTSSAEEGAEKRFVTLHQPETTEEQSRLKTLTFKTSSTKTYEVAIDLENADLLEFLELLFTQTLHRNYVVDPSARAKVTVHIKGNFSEKDLVEVVNHVLELQNLTIIPKQGVYYITNIAQISRFSGNYSFAIIKPKYLVVSNILSVVKSFTSRQAIVVPDKQSGSLIVVDVPENLKKVVKILTVLDRNILQDFYLELYRPQVIEAEKLADYLQKIFRSSVFKLNSPQNYVDFIPIEELNSLLIIAKDQFSMQTIKRWVVQLDSGETAERQVYVYYVENGSAEEIAKILQEAFNEVTESRRQTIVRAKTKATKKTKTISGKVKIIPDKTNNLLIIAATPDDYKTILNLLKDIDIIPRQVLIEVLIAEVSLNKNLEYGVEWWIKTNFNIEGNKYTGKIVSYNNYAGNPGKGFSFTVYRGLEPRALLSALSEVSEVHILSNPVILATDNKEAKIQIGEEVPTISQSVVNTSSQTPNITQNIQYRDVGIILGVKPHINSSGLVKLDVTQEISSVSDKTVQGVTSPVFTKRKIETSLVVQDGHTVILGGLIQNQHNTTETGVPLMKDIPVLGGLFRWRGTKKDRKELLVAITPRVVRSTEEAEKVMSEYRLRIEELKEKLSQEFKDLEQKFSTSQ